MEKKNNKFKHLNTILMYVTIICLLLSVVMYFFPFVVHKDNFSKVVTTFSGYDFTNALFSQEQSTKIFALQSLFASQKTGLPAKVIAYLSPICCVYSIVVVGLTLASKYKKSLNNIFVLGGFFAIWIVMALSVVTLVGSMAVTRGDITLNNYHIGFASMLGCGFAIVASVINIVKSLKE